MESNSQSVPVIQTENAEASNSNMSETCLESLGLVVNNGIPKFKIGEPAFVGVPERTDFSLLNDDESMSFVILGKDSVDSIQAMSRASYNDIQQKSMSIDCNSLISALSGREIQTKLSDLLQENVKLKETLKQNNVAMKQQFNTIVSWQEEMIKVRQKLHQSNKQKFAETRDLINHLRKENSELKLKLAADDQTDAQKERQYEMMSQLNRSLESFIQSCDRKEESTSANFSFMTQDNEKQEFKTFIQTSMDPTNEKERTDNSVQTSLQPIDHKSVTETSVQTCDKTQQSLKDIDLEKMAVSEYSDSPEAEFQQPSKELFNEIIIQHSPKVDNSPFYEGRQLFIQTVKKYNEKMHNLMNCFSAQSTRVSNVKDYLKESSKILDAFKFVCLAKKHPETGEFQFLVPDEIRDYKDRLYHYQRKLLGEQLNIISDKQNLVRTINEFQSLFSDYNTILCEMETINEENKKLMNMNSSVFHNSMENATELEKFKGEQNKEIEEKKHLVDVLKNELMEEKEQILSEKKNVKYELNCLQIERQHLEVEKMALQSERASLDQQSKLYETVLQSEKKSLEKRCGELHDKNKLLTEQADQNEMVINELQKDVTQKEQKIQLLQTQLQMYEEDFKEERIIKQRAIEEKVNLNEALQKQVELNNALRQQINELQNDGSAPQNVQFSSPYPCPVCSQYISSELEEHVERCLNSN